MKLTAMERKETIKGEGVGVKYPSVVVRFDLSGEEDERDVILFTVANGMRVAGISQEEIYRFMSEALSAWCPNEDTKALLEVVSEWVRVE